MTQSSATARIDAALARIEAAALQRSAAHASADQRLAALKAQVTEAIAALDHVLLSGNPN